MKFGVIIAARMNSSRLPGKVILPLNGIPVISFILRRLKRVEGISSIILATTIHERDDVLEKLGKEEGIIVFRGDEDDVLGRYVRAAHNQDFDYVVRVTGDCPFIGADTLDKILLECRKIKNFDLVTTKPAYPSGIDYEIYPKKLLEKIDQKDILTEEREHILNYIYNRKEDYKVIRLTPPLSLIFNKNDFLLDTNEDYIKIQKYLEDCNDSFISPITIINRFKEW